MTAVAREIGQPTPQWMDIFTQSGRALLAGDTANAERLNDEQAHAGERSGNLDAGFYFGVLLFAIRRDEGRLAEIADLVELVAADDDPTLGSSALWGVTLCTVGRDDEAAAVLARLAEGNFGGLGKNQVWSSIVWAAALIAAHLGDTARARRSTTCWRRTSRSSCTRASCASTRSRASSACSRSPPVAPRSRRSTSRGPKRSSSASMHRSCWSAPGAGAPGNFD